MQLVELKTLRKALRNPPALLGIFLILAFFFLAILAPFIATHDPLAIDVFNRFQPLSKRHLLGTDELGRDVFSRVIYGTRLTLQAGVTIVGIAFVVGTILGAIAGFWGGWTETLIMRTVDVFMSFPALILALAVAAALGPSLIHAVIALSVVWWPWYTRLVRGQILSVKESVYVEAGKALGASSVRLLFRHVLPNCISPIVVLATLDMGYAILTAAGLSFIGVGAQPPSPEWGAMLSTGRSYITTAWWYPTFPGIALSLIVLGFNLLGDGFRDLLDPRWRR